MILRLRFGKVCFWLAIICLLWLGAWFETAYARALPAVTMHASVGFQSYYDPRVWVPVRVTVTKDSSTAVSGWLVYHISGSRGRNNTYPYEGQLRWPVHFAGSTMTVTVAIPGKLLMARGNLNFVEHGISVASTRLLGAYADNSEIAGVVSDYPGAVQFLAGVSSTIGASALIAPYIQPRTLPSSMQLLQSLTFLYIDGSAASELSAGQIQAIFAWVRSGGILILGGLEPNAGQLSAFTQVSPVAGNIVLDRPANTLGAFVSSSAPHGDIPQLYGVAGRAATVLLGTTNQALLAVRTLGRGKVAYLGLDASSPALLSWSGNAMFWETLLHSLQNSVLSAKPDLFGTNGAWTLMGAAEQFPQLHAPPLWIWEVVFGLYIVACGPLLFFILRRRRKNEWAWILLPMLSVVVAGAIYELGVLERPNGILTQSVGLIDVVDAGMAQSVGVQALMSPQTRTYSVSTPPSTFALPLAERVSSASYTNDGKVSFIRSGASVQFTDVKAWRGRFAYAIHASHHFGSITGELFRSGNSVGGYLINDTAVDFTDLALVIQGQVLPLGSLSVGSDVKVQMALQNKGAPEGAFANQLGSALPNSSYGVGRALFDYARSYTDVTPPPGDALLIAWTHAEPGLFHTNGPVVLPARPQWIVRQVLPVTTVVE